MEPQINDNNKPMAEDAFIQKTADELTKQNDQTLNRGSGIAKVAKALVSSNFVSGETGWKLGSNSEVEVNGSRLVSTNFTPILTIGRLTLYLSNGTSPNGNLSGTTGDICIGANSGRAYYCTSGTSWTQL